MARAIHSPSVLHPNDIWWGVQMILLLVIWSSLPCYLIPLGQNIFLSPLFSKALSPYSSLSLKDQVSHPYKSTDETMIDEEKQSTLKAGWFISQETALYICWIGASLGLRTSLDAMERDNYGKTEPRFHSRPTGSLVTRPSKVPLHCAINNHYRHWHETAHCDVREVWP